MHTLNSIVLFLLVFAVASTSGCQKRAEPIAQLDPPEITTEQQLPEPVAKEKGEPAKPPAALATTKPFQQPAKQSQPQPKLAKPSLDHLDRKELTDAERALWLEDVVAVIPSDTKATIMSLAFSPDAKRLVISRSNSSVEFWDLTGKKPKLQGNLQLEAASGQASRVAFSKDGGLMASLHGTPGKTILLWKISPDGDIRLASTVEFPRSDNLAFHPNSKMLVATSMNDGEVLNIGPKGFERSQITFPGANSSLIFSPDGTTFACVVFNMARNGNLYGSEAKVWSIADNKVQETQMIQQDRTIKALAISPDKKTLATGALDNKVRLWDLTAKPPVSRQEFVMPTTWLKSLDFTSDGNFLLAVGANGGHVTLWNTKEGKAEKSWHFVMKKAGQGGGPFSAAAFAPDERHVAISTFNNPTTIILRLRR